MEDSTIVFRSVFNTSTSLINFLKSAGELCHDANMCFKQSSIHINAIDFCSTAIVGIELFPVITHFLRPMTVGFKIKS